ncbi:unnamed protein product [Arabidopsis thaliana]|uniref:(thale cress) hypothetical protein n=1 Tax=Arabidopsis thaliana TaxID=3702 RepID=A0A7G2EMK1_ARATH|nr:unnamed protein product [Arabidopsis thaliana]
MRQGETSSAQDDSLLRVVSIFPGANKTSCLLNYTSDHAILVLPLHLQSPMRILALVTLMFMLLEPPSLKFYGVCSSSPNCQSFDCDLGVPTIQLLVTIALSFKPRHSTLISQNFARILAKTLLRVVLLVPARSMLLATSQRH